MIFPIVLFIYSTHLLNAYNLRNAILSANDGLIDKCCYLEKSEITLIE